MAEIALILVLSFVVLLLINVPIAVAIALSTFFAVVAAGGDPNYTLAMKMANGIDSFALLAIPFFIFSGILMGRGGMARRLIAFAAVLVGRFPGGLAYINTLTCMLFGSISGSAAAAVSSVGGFMIPEMNKQGYNREFNVSVTTTAATTGLLIPPSNIMIVYAVASGSVSIAAMFMAGVFPGILTGLFIMVASGIIAVRRGYGSGQQAESIAARTWITLAANAVLIGVLVWLTRGEIIRFSFNPVGKIVINQTHVAMVLVCAAAIVSFPAFRRAFLSLLLIYIVIGGILGGVFTATEAAAVAVAYAFVITALVYREVKLADMPDILLQTGITTAVVMFLIGASSGMSWLLTTQNIPQTVSAALLGLSDSPIVIFLTINLLLLAVGTFMDMTPAVLIFTPIFLPVVVALGMHEVHFGIMLIANLCIGLCTPPVGTCLFIGCGVGQTTIAKVTRHMIPFFFAMFLALMVITYWAPLSMWLPQALELIEAR
jgi:TRAP-type C4-dicarboxylate transport system permease large subunit